jgi:rRNA maturation protein Rpf1
VARDILTRELEESVAYARTQRARHVLVVGSPRTGPDHLLVLDLPDGGERTLSVREVLGDPERYFGGLKESSDA